ncbi:hypothetical protein D3C75_723860 [compost metagenome]
MAKAAWVGVAVVVGKLGIVFGAVVVGQLQHARDRLHPLVAFAVIGRDLRRVYQGQEVQAEGSFGEVALVHQAEAQHAGVEVQRLLDVLDPQHGVVEDELGGGGVRLRGDARQGLQIVQAHGNS